MPDPKKLSRVGPYALEEPLGDPRRGHVFRGFHVQRRRSMAIRLLPPERVRGGRAIKLFAGEVRLLQKLVHPNLARPYGGDIEDGQPFLVCELVPGESLAERLQRCGKLPWESAIELIEQVCRGAGFAHHQGVVHQRIAEDQVLISESGIVKLIGFGAAWFDAPDAPRRVPLDRGQYLAPEQFQPQAPVTPQSDLYGIGVLLARMLVGQFPFQAATVEELVAAKTDQPAPRLSAFDYDCPVWLDVLVNRLLQPDPRERPASAQEVVEALHDSKRYVTSGIGTAQRALSAKQSTLRVEGDRSALNQIRRKRVRSRSKSIPFHERAWFLAVCLLMLVAVGAWALWPAGESELFAEAERLMALDDRSEWYRARDHYLRPLLERYPSGTHAQQTRRYLRQIEMDTAHNKMTLNMRLGRPPTSEHEATYRRGWEFEQFGDLAAARNTYLTLASAARQSLRDDQQHFVLLAAERAETIRASDGAASRSDLQLSQLQRAERLAAEGQHHQARQIWQQIISLYEGEPGSLAAVEEARRRLASQGAT